MSIMGQKAREINGKEAFARWVELGSCTRVAAELTRKGAKNAKGIPFHSASIYMAIMRYVSEHPDEARPVYIAQGVELALDDDEWWVYVIKKAWTRLKARPQGFVEWLDKWGLKVENYPEIFGEYMPYLIKVRADLIERRKAVE